MAIKAGRLIEYQAPDEGSGAANAPTLKVGDREYGLDEARRELERIHDWNRTNAERADENKRDREHNIREREMLSRERESLQADRSQPAQPPPVPRAPRKTGREFLGETLNIKDVDLTGDPDAAEKLQDRLFVMGDMVDQRLAEMEQSVEQRLAAKDFEIGQKVEQVQEATNSRLSQDDQRRTAEERNARVLDDYLQKHCPTMTREEKQEVERKYRQKIGPEYGRMDMQARVWLYSDKAAEDALRSSSVFDRIKQEEFDARLSKEKQAWFQNRLDQQDAGSSTPRLARPTVVTPSDEAFFARAREVNSALTTGAIDREEVIPRGMMSLEELKRWQGMPPSQRANILSGRTG